MNILLSSKKETIDTIGKIKENIESYQSKIDELNKRKEELEKSKNYLSNPSTSPLLFYFYSGRDSLDIFNPNIYNNYFFNYQTNEFMVTSSQNKPYIEYPNAIDISKYFEDIDEELINDNMEVTLKYISIRINRFVDYLINEYDPETWDILTGLVKESLKNGKYTLKK